MSKSLLAITLAAALIAEPLAAIHGAVVFTDEAGLVFPARDIQAHRPRGSWRPGQTSGDTADLLARGSIDADILLRLITGMGHQVRSGPSLRGATQGETDKPSPHGALIAPRGRSRNHRSRVWYR